MSISIQRAIEVTEAALLECDELSAIAARPYFELAKKGARSEWPAPNNIKMNCIKSLLRSVGMNHPAYREVAA